MSLIFSRGIQVLRHITPLTLPHLIRQPAEPPRASLCRRVRSANCRRLRRPLSTHHHSASSAVLNQRLTETSGEQLFERAVQHQINCSVQPGQVPCSPWSMTISASALSAARFRDCLPAKSAPRTLSQPVRSACSRRSNGPPSMKAVQSLLDLLNAARTKRSAEAHQPSWPRPCQRVPEPEANSCPWQSSFSRRQPLVQQLVQPPRQLVPAEPAE